MNRYFRALVASILAKAIISSVALAQREDAQAEQERRQKVMLEHQAKRAEREKALQASFARFQRLEPQKTASGHPKFQTIVLNKDPLIIDGARYDGFRFKVNRNGIGSEKLEQNLVWGFVLPANLNFWYIVPQSGAMDGFRRFFQVRKKDVPQFRGLEPLSMPLVLTQALSGSHLVDSEEYLIFFCFTDDKVARFAVALGFAPLETETSETILAALGVGQES